MADSLHVRRYQPGDEAGIQRLFKVCFGEERSDELWRWRFLDSPAGQAFILVAIDGSDVVGHCAWCLFHGVVAGQPVSIALGGDMMVHPDHQRRGIAQMLINEREQFGQHDLRISFPTEAVLRLKRPAVNSRELGELPMWVRWRTARSLAESRSGAVGGPIAGALLGVWRGVARLRAAAARVTVAEASSLGADVDALAHDAQGWSVASRTRDAAYLRWRWIDQPESDWTVLTARRRGRLTGVVVFGRWPASGSTGRIVDLLASDAPSHSALLDAAAQRLEAGGADLVELMHADSRSWVRRATRFAGFARRGDGPTVLVSRQDDGLSEASCQELTSWYLTAGDTDLV
jgi:GNAT superfamily N-acetyltransferase